MKRLAASAILPLLFLSVGYCQTATPTTSPATKDPTAVALAQKAMTAMGSSSLSTYLDSTSKGSITYHIVSDFTMPVTVKSKGTTKSRWDIQKSEAADVSISDGSKSCMVEATGAQIRLSVLDLYSKRVDHIPVLTLLSEYASPSMNVQYAGSADINGSLADVIALSFSIPGLPSGYDGSKLTQHLFYIDRATGYVAKMQLYRADTVGPGVTRIEMVFSNYQSISGIAVPMKRSLYVDGKIASDLTLTSVVFNTGLSDSDFVPTCGGAQ